MTINESTIDQMLTAPARSVMQNIDWLEGLLEGQSLIRRVRRYARHKLQGLYGLKAWGNW